MTVSVAIYTPDTSKSNDEVPVVDISYASIGYEMSLCLECYKEHGPLIICKSCNKRSSSIKLLKTKMTVFFALRNALIAIRQCEEEDEASEDFILDMMDKYYYRLSREEQDLVDNRKLRDMKGTENV